MNEPPIERFRASYPSLVATLLLEIFLLSPCLMLSPCIFIKNEDLAIIIGLGLAGLVIVLTIIRYLSLRVEIGPWFIVKRGILGTKRIDLDPDCRFRYNIAQFFNNQGSDLSNNYTVIVKGKTSTIRLTSGIKGMVKIARFCLEYETNFIFPEMCRQMSQGIWIDSGPIRQSAETVIVGRKNLSKPLKFEPEMEDGVLVLFESESLFGRIKVRAKTIWNPHATFALLSNSSPGHELSIEEPQFLTL